MREGPVTRIKLPNGSGWAWLLTRYDDVRMVTNDPRFSRKLVADHDVTRLAPHFIPVDGAVGFEDPPDHTRLRRAVAPAFTTRGVERLRDRAREMLDELVEGVLRDGPPADLTERLLGPFPLAVVCELMGVPAADRPRMHEWTNLILSSAQGAERSQRAKEEMCGYFAELMRGERGRRRRRGDCRRPAVHGRRGRGTHPSESVGLALLIQIGGEAVTNNTGNMLFILLNRPRPHGPAAGGPAVRPRAIEELLRYIPHRSAVGLSRIALEDVTVAGARSGRARRCTCRTRGQPGPGRLPAPGPDRLLTGRPTRTWRFGYRAALLRRGDAGAAGVGAARRRPRGALPGIRLAVPAEEVRFRKGALIRGPESMPVVWS